MVVEEAGVAIILVLMVRCGVSGAMLRQINTRVHPLTRPLLSLLKREYL